MRPVLAILLAGLLLAGCDDDPAGPADRFAGRYDWTVSTGGFAPTTRSPASEGYTARLEFDGHGTVRGYRDGALVATAAYTATELPTMGPLPVWTMEFDPALAVLPFAALHEETVRYVQNGIIEFADPCCDGWTHAFTEFGIR